MNKLIALALADYLKDSSSHRLKLLVSLINPQYKLAGGNKKQIESMLQDIRNEPSNTNRMKMFVAYVEGNTKAPKNKTIALKPIVDTSKPDRDKLSELGKQWVKETSARNADRNIIMGLEREINQIQEKLGTRIQQPPEVTYTNQADNIFGAMKDKIRIGVPKFVISSQNNNVEGLNIPFLLNHYLKTNQLPYEYKCSFQPTGQGSVKGARWICIRSDSNESILSIEEQLQIQKINSMSNMERL